MEAQITAVCRDGYRSIPVCSKHSDLPGITPVQHIGMREAKDVILSTADDSDAGSNGIEEWFRTGCEAAVMGDEQDIAFDSSDSEDTDREGEDELHHQTLDDIWDSI